MSGASANPWLDGTPPTRFARFYRGADWPAHRGVRLAVPTFRKAVKNAAFAKMCAALDVLHATSPQQLSRLPDTIHSIAVAPADGALACWRRELRAILVDPDFVLTRTTTPELLASVIVHELTHARLERAGFEYLSSARIRIERVCLLAERNFIARLPISAERSRLERINAGRLKMRINHWTDAAFAARRAAWRAKQPLWRRALLAAVVFIRQANFAAQSNDRWS